MLKHCLTGNEFTQTEIKNLLSLAAQMKNNPDLHKTFLKDKHIALVLDKPSLRTRFSFIAAIEQLGGQVLESVAQTRKQEEPKDFIRVIQGYCAALVMRTFEDKIFSEMLPYTQIPIINGLTNLYHPCQALADLLTLKQKFPHFGDLKIAYLGDGNNVLHSLILMANKLGITVHYCCPQKYQPNPAVLATAAFPELIHSFSEPKQAVLGCHAIYTDVWTSMGFTEKSETDFIGYQVNQDLMNYAADGAIFMHCMPMQRGKEVSDTLPDAACSAVFAQSENRLHVQKALLITLLNQGELK